MSTKYLFARSLADVFLCGTWSLEELVRRGGLACGRREPWLRPLLRRVIAGFGETPTRPTWETLTAFIDADAGLCKAWIRHREDLKSSFRRILLVTATMTPVTGKPASWSVPALPTSTALADWLGLKPAQLDWFADCHGHEGDVKAGPLRHYTLTFVAIFLAVLPT